MRQKLHSTTLSGKNRKRGVFSGNGGLLWLLLPWSGAFYYCFNGCYHVLMVFLCYFSSRKQYLAHPRNNGCFLPNVIATTRHSFILKCTYTVAAAMGKWCNINCMPFLQAQFIQRFITSLFFVWSELQPIFKRAHESPMSQY